MKAGPGRPKGLQNKTTVAAKEAMDMAFRGLGGVPSLIEWAKKNPTEFYRLWAKRIPQETSVQGHDGGPLTVAVVYSRE